MATRFYMPVLSVPWTIPPGNASWEAPQTFRSLLSPVRKRAPFNTQLANEVSPSNVYDNLIGQFTSPPIAAMAIAGTVKGIIRAAESDADADMRAQLSIYVFNADRTVLRGTLLAHNEGALASEFSLHPTFTNRKFPLAWGAPVALTPVVAQDYDCIVVEVGYRAHNVTPGLRTGYLEFGDNSATDLAENETDTLPGNPWFEFSEDFTFLDNISGRRGATTQLITQLNQKARPPVQLRGDSYEHDASANSPSDIDYRSRPGSFRSGEDEIVDGQGDFPGKLPIRHFVMKAYNTVLTQYVTWESPRVPDFVGDLSGYPIIQLTNIAIIGSYKEFFH